MACNIVSPVSFLLLALLLSSCMISMHACDARLLGISGFQFEHQELLGRGSESGNEVNVEGEIRDSLLGSKVANPEDPWTGNEATVSPSSQINARATEWKAIRRQVGEEVMAKPGSRDGTVDYDALDSVDSDVGEHTAVMDYAQPHRKPPIHNEKP